MIAVPLILDQIIPGVILDKQKLRKDDIRASEQKKHWTSVTKLPYFSWEVLFGIIWKAPKL